MRLQQKDRSFGSIGKIPMNSGWLNKNVVRKSGARSSSAPKPMQVTTPHAAKCVRSEIASTSITQCLGGREYD